MHSQALKNANTVPTANIGKSAADKAPRSFHTE